jgi:hypothetical protein
MQLINKGEGQTLARTEKPNKKVPINSHPGHRAGMFFLHRRADVIYSKNLPVSQHTANTMKSVAFILFILLTAVSNISAQGSANLKATYTNGTIYRYGSYFMKGTERLTFANLKPEFAMSDLGLAAYEKSRKYRTISTVLRLLSLGTAIFTLRIVSNNNINYNQRTTIYILLGGQLATALAASRYSQLSSQNVDKAIWERNKDLLFPPR